MSLNGFEYEPLEEPSLLKRVVRGGFSDNAYREIRNRLATGPVTALSREEVEATLERYGLSRLDAHAAFTGIYRTLLDHRTADGHLSVDDRAQLAHLRSVLTLTNEDIAAIEADVLGAQLRLAFAQAFADGRLSDDERQRLARMATNFSLPDDVVRRIHREEARKAWQVIREITGVDAASAEER